MTALVIALISMTADAKQRMSDIGSIATAPIDRRSNNAAKKAIAVATVSFKV
jgi:hypothetical protein